MAQIIERKKCSDGAIAIRLRADGADEAHDSWHMYYVNPATTATELETWVNDCKAKVDQQYAALTNADNLLAQLT